MTAHHMPEVAGALRTTTEVLAAELACPTDQAPTWSNFEWRIARAAASLHGVSSLLSHTLRWQAPQDWIVFLKDQAEHTARRFERIQQLLIAIDSAACNCGIPVMALKGAALYARGVYMPGTRPMADVDLLVREQDGPRAMQMLATLDYLETSVCPRHIVFELRDCPSPQPFGEHAANGIKIELHTRISESLPLRQVEVTSLLFPINARPGINDYPSLAAQMAHLLLHAAGCTALRTLRLIHLHDIGRLSSHMATTDWIDLQSRFSDPRRGLWWAYPPLVLTSRYVGQIPAGVLDATASGCPLLLRRACGHASLSDVSMSSPGIRAFPGIEWSRSAGEALAYLAQRLGLLGTHLRARQTLSGGESVHYADASTHVFQARHVLRWAKSRPVRVGTTRAVRGALAHPL